MEEQTRLRLPFRVLQLVLVIVLITIVRQLAPSGDYDLQLRDVEEETGSSHDHFFRELLEVETFGKGEPERAALPFGDFFRRWLKRGEDDIKILDNAQSAEEVLAGCGSGCKEVLETKNKEAVSIYVGTNQSVYRFGDVLVGAGSRWEEDRNTIIQSSEFEGTVMQKYFHTRPKWDRYDIDFPELGRICRDGWSKYRPAEPLTIHFRNGDNIFDSFEQVVTCASDFLEAHKSGEGGAAPLEVNAQGRIPLRLVTIQHYGANEELGKFFASAESIQKGNEVAQSMIDTLVERGFDVTVQSSESSDVDFCTLIQADDVCLSLGGFDSVVHSVRQQIGLRNTQKNFLEVPYGYFHRQAIRAEKAKETQQSPIRPSSYKRERAQDLYEYGDAVFGLTPNWKVERSTITTHPEFAGTLLQQYFKNKQHVHVDGPLLLNLCQTRWSASLPSELLVVHQRDTDVGNTLQCINDFRRTFEGTPSELTARLVTPFWYKPGTDSDNTSHKFSNPSLKRLLDGMHAQGYNVTIQSSANVMLAVKQASKAATASEAAASAAAHQNWSDDQSGISLVSSELVASISAVQTAGKMATRTATAVAAAAADADFCTLLLAKHTCLAKGHMDQLVNVVHKQTNQAKRAKRKRGKRARKKTTTTAPKYTTSSVTTTTTTGHMEREKTFAQYAAQVAERIQEREHAEQAATDPNWFNIATQMETLAQSLKKKTIHLAAKAREERQQKRGSRSVLRRRQ